MTDKSTFEIFVFKKIQVLTNTFLTLFFISVLAFCLIYAAANDKRDIHETINLHFINVSTMKLLFISLTSAALFFVLAFKVKKKETGSIIFYRHSIEIFTKDNHLSIPVKNLNIIRYNDTEDKKGIPNKKFSTSFVTVDEKKIIVSLRDIADLKIFLDKLLSLDNPRIDYFHDNWVRTIF